MIGLSYNPLGIFNSSGLVNVGEGYYQTGFNYQTINSESQIIKKEYAHYINRDGIVFPPTERTLINDNFISISQNYNNQKLNNFLTGVIGYRLIGTIADRYSTRDNPQIVGPIIGWATSNLPQARDALAYNLIVKNKNTISPMNEWTWFEVSGAPEPNSWISQCGGVSFRPDNWNGYYTNIYNIHPDDGDKWLYNYSTPNVIKQCTVDNGVILSCFAYGAVTWLVSGRKSVYYNDGRPIYYKVNTYPFSYFYYKGEIYNVNINNTGIATPEIINGIPYSGERYLDIQNVYNNIKDYSARFFWSGNISRWVFNVKARGCFGASTATGINVTGLNSGDFPWTTNWPSGVNANLLN